MTIVLRFRWNGQRRLAVAAIALLNGCLLRSSRLEQIERDAPPFVQLSDLGASTLGVAYRGPFNATVADSVSHEVRTQVERRPDGGWYDSRCTRMFLHDHLLVALVGSGCQGQSMTLDGGEVVFFDLVTQRIGRAPATVEYLDGFPIGRAQCVVGKERQHLSCLGPDD